MTTEIIGYVASALVLFSFMMKDMKTLRWMNVFGCGAFIFYGILIESVPVLITNASIVLVNFYYLFLKKA